MCAEVSKPSSPLQEGPQGRPESTSGRSSSLRSVGALALESSSPKAAIQATAAQPNSFKHTGKGLSKQVSFTESDAVGDDEASSNTQRRSLGNQANSTSSLPRTSSAKDTEGALERSTHLSKGVYDMKDVLNEMLLKGTASKPNSNLLTQPAKKGIGQRRSLPCLKVSTKKVTEGGDKRRVSFVGGAPDLYEAYTPYCKKYGAHPSEFYFDAEGHMVLEEKDGLEEDIKIGDTLECIVDCGVSYRRKPQMTARFEDLRTLDVAHQTKVLQRCGDWVQDSVGWLPLTISSKPVLQVVVPKEKLKFVTCRVAVAVFHTSADADQQDCGKGV